jgi:hypothetical protein
MFTTELSLLSLVSPTPSMESWRTPYENKILTVSLLNALYAEEFNCTLCRNLLAQNEKQLKLIFLSLPQMENMISPVVFQLKPPIAEYSGYSVTQ